MKIFLGIMVISISVGLQGQTEAPTDRVKEMSGSENIEGVNIRQLCS